MAASKKRVGIVGAAISGPVFALQILSHPVLKERYKPILFEQLGPPHKRDVTKASQHQKPVIHTAGAAVGIFSNGLYPLFELGLRPDLEEFSCEMADLDVWRGNLKGQHRLFNNLKNAGWDAELRTCPRIFERQRLRDSLLRYVLQLGGEIKWDAKVRGVRAREKERPHISLENGETVTVDLLVGADGTWSLVRKFIMEQRNRNATEKRWPAPFTGVAGIYGISSSASIAKSICGDGQSKAILVLLDRGNIGALPLEDGKIAWTMHLPETKAPERSNPATASKPRGGDLLESKMVPGVYDPNYTAEILRAHQNIFHPELGSFKHVFESSERIIHSPLRQQVWNEEEIQWGNIALIGDAARVMPPYTGQGEGCKQLKQITDILTGSSLRLFYGHRRRDSHGGRFTEQSSATNRSREFSRSSDRVRTAPCHPVKETDSARLMVCDTINGQSMVVAVAS